MSTTRVATATAMLTAPQPDLPIDLERYPKLSKEQAGHLRHFHNLATADDGEWPHMGAQEPAQEFLDAYRYQLATMAYASGVTHYHRMPAMRGIFKPLMRRLIHKMLRREVWGYWYLTSQSGKAVDPDLKELRKPWADPIIRENIMYSGHLLLMTGMYTMLFDDDEFEKPGSLTFHWDPMFWGMGPETFEYDIRSLQDAIIGEMRRNKWIGACCEPNVVFVACNQFPVWIGRPCGNARLAYVEQIIGMRYLDARHGTHTADDVLKEYRAALEKSNLVSNTELFKDFVAVKQNVIFAPKSYRSAAFMHAWNPEFVESGYEAHSTGFITNVDGTVELHHPVVAQKLRALMQENGIKDVSSAMIKEAREHYLATKDSVPKPPGKKEYGWPVLGYVVQWLSELGKSTELQGLLHFADENLRPTWEKGGLFYPRNDSSTDSIGRLSLMEPFTGNGAIGYARLNVADGQKKMWEQPWTRETLQTRPWVDGIDLSSGVNCLRGEWDEKSEVLIVTLSEWQGKRANVTMTARNLPGDRWAVYKRQGDVVGQKVCEGSEIVVDVSLEAGEEVDLVISRT
ncbi:hypothetical protein N7468_002083 [Penicillium chermesinum]|uniref:Linalool dehydratase/isomerase domain-containing protein n=1 Tax=Penicillium chermesinum TaxID=63820 RepID=A0A9W9PHT8_9EURO|nr:uncharacterized protein N7468_002083 [Penicillium chermesinum]KAJ5247100.1 hypothetical protein N7468_002083 [Penicillium chermesinum]